MAASKSTLPLTAGRLGKGTSSFSFILPTHKMHEWTYGLNSVELAVGTHVTREFAWPHSGIPLVGALEQTLEPQLCPPAQPACISHPD